MEISRTKQKQRDNILKHSRELFLKKGIANTSIKEIAESAGIYRKTVYNHFADKEEIATIILKYYTKNFSSYEPNFDTEKTAFELLSIMVADIVEYAKSNRDTFRYMAHYDYYFNEKSGLIDDSTTIDSTPLHNIIMLGEKDGSIYMHNTTSAKLAFTIIRSFSKFLEDILYRESIYKQEYSFNEEDIKIYFNILLRGLQS